MQAVSRISVPAAEPVRQQTHLQQTNGNKKKLTIVPLKQRPQLPENFEASTWQKLQVAVCAVFKNTSVDLSFEELYRAVEDVCMHKLAQSMYTQLADLCQGFIYANVDRLLDQSCYSDHTGFLALADSVWTTHCEHVLTIRNIFLYLDRSYAMQVHTSGVVSIWDLCLRFFGERLQQRHEAVGKLVVGLLAMVQSERHGQSVDKRIVRRLLRMLFAVGLYRHFEEPFLMESERFFASEGQELIDSLDAASYLKHVERRLQQAVDMVTQYLDVGSRVPLIATIDNRLLRPHTTTLLDRGVATLFNENKVSDLKRLFVLLDRVEALTALKDTFSSHIRRTGEALVADETRDKTLIEDLLALQEKVNVVMQQAFTNLESFKYALKDSFEKLINPTKQPNRTAELLARFLDRKLRGEKGVTEVDMEETFDRTIILFRYIQCKDIFEAFYKKLLSKRLLLGKSASNDLEKSVLCKLKSECGSNFTSKLEGMFQDMEFSRAVMEQYSAANSACVPSSSSVVQCNFQVLNAGFWPSCSPITVVLPRELSVPRDHFVDFYTERYQGRRLVWNQALDRCMVTARFPRGKKELDVTLFQTAVLLCFNKPAASDLQGLTIDDIASETKMEIGELRRTLQSLACGIVGTRVLTKEPKGKDIEFGDRFIVNEDFSNKMFRIKINTIQLRETVEETEQTLDEVFRDRQYQVDAAIVRTMKARKSLAHNLLMSELMTQLQFPARPADIKKRIESLIEREYLTRDTEDASKYVYLA